MSERMRRAVAALDRIARQVEQDPMYQEIVDAQRHAPEATTADAIMANAPAREDHFFLVPKVVE